MASCIGCLGAQGVPHVFFRMRGGAWVGLDRVHRLDMSIAESKVCSSLVMGRYAAIRPLRILRRWGIAIWNHLCRVATNNVRSREDAGVPAKLQCVIHPTVMKVGVRRPLFR